MLPRARTTKMLLLNIGKSMTGQRINICFRMCSVSTKTTPCLVDEIKSDQTPAKPFEAIPGPTGIYNLPYIGFLFHLKPCTEYTTGTVDLLLQEMYKKYGSIFKILLSHPSVIISDPKDVAQMMRNEGKYPLRPNFEIFDVYYRRTNRPRNITNTIGPEWWELRAPMQRILMRPGQLSQYLPMMNGVADDFMKMVTRGNMENYTAEEAFMAYGAESAGTAIFNRRLGFLDEIQTEETKSLQKAAWDLFDILYTTTIGKSIAFRFYKSKDYKSFESAKSRFSDLSLKYVREAKEKINLNEMDGKSVSDERNMIRSLLNYTTEDKVALIIDGAFTASMDTTASVMQVVLHTLAKHPDKQDKLRDEIQNVLGKEEDKTYVTQEHFDKMPYLKAFVKEVYRFRNIFPFGPARVLPVDVVLGGYNVPAGATIYMYNAIACRDENVFENPHVFMPERWLRQNKQGPDVKGDSKSKADSDSSWALLPFGMGPRGCPGRCLFEQELFLIVTKLLHKMKVGLAAESVVTEFEYRLLLKPVKSLKFTFTPLDTK